MIQIVNGKRYNTDTAEFLAQMPCSYVPGDHGYHVTGVYRTAKGNFFLAGEGGPLSIWGRRGKPSNQPGDDLFGWTASRGIVPIEPDKARQILEGCGPEGGAAIEKYFPIEDA